MKRPRPPEDHEREERIAMQIIVDAYNESEVRMGWYCYLEDKLAFPFQAACIVERGISPLELSERVTVLGMLDVDESDDLNEMMVEIELQDRRLGVPLAQLHGVKVDSVTAEAIGDWHYWVAQSRSF